MMTSPTSKVQPARVEASEAGGGGGPSKSVAVTVKQIDIRPAFIPQSMKSPLVALLDGMNCWLEMEGLSGVAAMAFCNAKDGTEIHAKVYEEAVAIILWHAFKLGRAELEKFQSLKVIARIGAGVDNIDIKAAGELGIAVSNITGPEVEDMADSTLSLILNLYRRCYWLANLMNSHGSRTTFGLVQGATTGMARIRGETLGIVGLGRVGTAVALRAQALGFHVIFYDPYLRDGIEHSLGLYRCHTFQFLLYKADCISLHCSLNDKNLHLLDEQAFRLMRKGAYLVNTAHQELVDEMALGLALCQGKVGGAALDVRKLEFENLPDPLKLAPNLICTPHSAQYSDSTSAELRRMAAEEVRRAIVDKKNMPDCLSSCVNRHFLKKTVERSPAADPGAQVAAPTAAAAAGASAAGTSASSPPPARTSAAGASVSSPSSASAPSARTVGRLSADPGVGAASKPIAASAAARASASKASAASASIPSASVSSASFIRAPAARKSTYGLPKK